MNKEVVSVMVHTPKRERRKPARHVFPSPGTAMDEQKPQKRSGKPSRRWLASEVDKVFEKNAELVKQLELHKEVEQGLIDAKTKLERELALLKSRKAVGSHENEAIRERNKQLSQDVFIMKNILVKLNFELERYQEKLRKYEDRISKDDNESESAGMRRGCRREWIDGEITIFAPLLLAYEESIKEKDDLIKDLRSAVEHIAAKMKDIIKENTQLHTKMAESEKKGEVTYSDWLSVQRELSTTVEQNQLLSRQAKLAQSQISDLKSAFQAKLNEVCSERDDLATKLGQLRTDFLVLRGKSSTLEQELDRMKQDSAERIPKSVHSAYIAECKRLLDELKMRHEEERSSLQRKITSLESESHQQLKMSSSSSTDRIKELETRLSESEERCAKVEKRRDFLKGRLDCLVTFAKELIAEHESLLKGVNGELKMNAGLSARIDQIKRQLKSVELETLQQIRMLDENISSQVERVNKVRSEQSQEVLKLRGELTLREAHIQNLKDALMKREEDMEIVWKAALSDRRERSTDDVNLEIKDS